MSTTLDLQEAFMKAVEAVSHLQPELFIEIAKRLNDLDFFWATTRNGNELLLTVLQRRKMKGISTNLYIYGGGSTQVGKSVAALIIAAAEDPAFALDQLMFDFSELDRQLPKTQQGKRYILDDVRNRLVGTGAVAETERVIDFMETNAEAGISLTVVSPKFNELAAINYRIELLGFCDEFSLGILYNRKGTPIAWMHFTIIEPVKSLIPEYRRMKRDFRTKIKVKGAGAGYISGKIEEMYQDIQEQGIEFTGKSQLRDHIILNYDSWTQRTQDAAFRQLSKILFPEEEAGVDAETIEVQEGQSFRDFLEEYLPPSLIKSIIGLYRVDNLSRQDEVAKALELDSAARVSEQITIFTEKRLGDLYEIWYNNGGEPAKEGEVDAWEDGTPTNLKCTYSSRKKLRIPTEKMRPELIQALEKDTKVRIRAYNLYYNKEVAKDFDPQEISKRGVAVVSFG